MKTDTEKLMKIREIQLQRESKDMVLLREFHKKHDEWIPKEEMIEGQVYLCNGRNFNLGVWNGKEFEYMRYKFGGVFPDTEKHWDDGAPHGTAKPYKLIEINE